MKLFKTITSLLSLSVVLVSIASCAGGKDSMYSLEQEAPFKVGTVYFQKWVAGVEGGGSGTNVYVTIEEYTDAVTLRNIYFREGKQALQTKPNLPDNYTGYFTEEVARDFTMDGDIKKEGVNTPPEPFPFKLRDNEAVLSYIHNGELKFLKIGPMEEKPMLAYPSVNPNGID